MREVKIEKLGEVLDRQSILTTDQQTLLDNVGREALVRTTTIRTGFGNYLMNLEALGQ
jgi:hypothetical protein